MDRNEREPLLLVIKVFILGAISTIPAVILEVSIEKIFPFMVSETPNLETAFYISFIQVAPVEELCKLAVVLLFVWKNPEFNEENDGIVYTGASALGFATFENIFYVFDYGFATGILRAITSIPLHCFTGVIMGYYLGIAKFSHPDKVKQTVLKGFFIAVLIHGIYDTFALSETEIGILILPLTLGTVLFGVKLLKEGRLLSIKRWSEQQEDIVRIAENNIQKKSGIWQIIISRILVLLCVIFWILLFVGILEETSNTEVLDLIMGGAMITFFPISIAIFLEVSYARRNN